jgi:hypothetical protein
MSVSTLTKAIDAMEISLRELRDALALALAATPETPPLALAATPETPPLALAATPEQTPAPAEPKKKGPNAWNTLISQTVADMKQNGWESFCDSSQPPVLWPASRMDGENYVYDGGEHDGKPPTQARGGMVRASYLKSLSDPAAKAKAEAHRVRRSQEIQKRAAAKAAKTSSAEKSDASTVTPITEPASSMKKLCCSCKHELPLAMFLKERKHMMGGNEVRVLKCCEICREKQKVRTAEGGHNERHNAAAKAQRHALKAAVAAGEPEAIAILAAAREMRDKKNAELLAAMQSGSESEATLAGGGSVESKKRKPLTEEQKAAAKAKRQAKKEAKKEAAKPTTTIDYPTWWPGAADF